MRTFPHPSLADEEWPRCHCIPSCRCWVYGGGPRLHLSAWRHLTIEQPYRDRWTGRCRITDWKGYRWKWDLPIEDKYVIDVPVWIRAGVALEYDGTDAGWALIYAPTSAILTRKQSTNPIFGLIYVTVFYHMQDELVFRSGSHIIFPSTYHLIS